MAKENFKSLREESSKNDSKQGASETHLYDIVGHFGRFQFLIFIFKIGVGVTSAINNLGVNFFAPREFVSYWCADDHYNQSMVNSSSVFNPFIMQTINNSTLTSSTGGGVLDTFATFLWSEERNRRHAGFSSWTVPSGIRKECFDQDMNRCKLFRYDTGIWISTLIDEYDFVCERSWYISWTQSLYMIGNMSAYLIFGYLSDRYGRKRTVILGALIEIFTGLGCALSNSSFMYLFFRFWCGFGNAGRSSTSYLLMIEWVGPEWGITISSWGALGWGIGYTILPWISAYFLHFRHVHLFACSYEFSFVIILLFLPESPRFLLTQKRFAEAHKIIFQAAYFNGLIKEPQSQANAIDQAQQVQLPLQTATMTDSLYEPKSSALQPYTKEEFDIKFEKLVETMNRKVFTKKENKLTIIDVFRWKHLRFYALILYCIWASNSFIFYGIALGSTAIAGTNFFSSFSILGLMEIPGIILTIVLSNYLPQNPTYTIVYALTGFLCMMEIPFEATNHPNVQLVNRIIAKLLNTISFNSLLYITIEVFPTSIRQTAYSSCSLMGRIGANLAPFIKELTLMTNSYVAPIIYTILNIISAFLVRLVPDTDGLDMTDTLLEAEKLGEKERLKTSTRSQRKLTA